MNDLADELSSRSQFDIRSAIVAEVDETTGTCSLFFGPDDTVAIPEIEYLNSATPEVGTHVWVGVAGEEMWVMGKMGPKQDIGPVPPGNLPTPDQWFAVVDPPGPPAAPQNVRAETTLSGIVLSFRLPPEALYRTWEIYEGTTQDFTPTTPIAVIDTIVHTIPHDPGTGPWWIKLRAKNSRGEFSPFVTLGPLTLDTVPEHIDASGITSTMIESGAISSPKIAAGAITAEKVAANAITAEKIVAGAITAGKIATGSITAESGVIASLDAGKITTGYMTATRIQGGTITGVAINGVTLTGCLFQTAESGPRVVVSVQNFTGSSTGEIAFYDSGSYYNPSGARILSDSGLERLSILSSTNSGYDNRSKIELSGPGTPSGCKIAFTSAEFTLNHPQYPTQTSVIINGTLYAERFYPAPYISYSNGTEGTWIQDSYTISQCWKIFFNSNTKKLYVGRAGAYYMTAALTQGA